MSAKSYFLDSMQIEKWIDASESIKERFGLNKALGYLIGEKLFDLIKQDKFYKEFISNPKFNKDPETVKSYKEKINLLEPELNKFVVLIKETFQPYEISKFLNSVNRFGALGHTASEDQHDFFIKNKVIDHSIDTEIEDSLILGKILKRFDLLPTE